MSSSTAAGAAPQDEGWQQVTQSGRKKALHIIHPGDPGAAEAAAAAVQPAGAPRLTRKQQYRREKRKAAAAAFHAEVTAPLQAATNASRAELGLDKPKRGKGKGKGKGQGQGQEQRNPGAVNVHVTVQPPPSATAHGQQAQTTTTAAGAAGTTTTDADDEGFEILTPLATTAAARPASLAGMSSAFAPSPFAQPQPQRAAPLAAAGAAAAGATGPAASPALTPPPPCVSPSLWFVNKDAFRNEQATRARLLQALAAVDNYPPMAREYPRIDLAELCAALNVPVAATVRTRETVTREEILEDAFLVLAYALEQCNEHVYLQKLMPRYLSTLPADDNVKATINTDSRLVDAYMRASETTALNVDWATGRLGVPLFRDGANPAGADGVAAPAAGKTATKTATTATATGAPPKKRVSKSKYDKWMESLGWNSMNKTRQLYTLWNNYYVTSGRKDVWDVATDAFGLDGAADAAARVAELKAGNLVGPVGKLPYRLPVWTNQKEWRKASPEQHQRHIDWRAYEHNIVDGHCIMVERLTRVFGEPWSVRNSTHHLGKFLKQFREVVRIKEGLNHVHENSGSSSSSSGAADEHHEQHQGCEDPVPRAASPAPPALSSVAHVIAEMKKVVTVCGPHIVLLPQMLAMTSGPVDGAERDAAADHSRDTLNGTVLATHPVIGRILPHASRILMDYYYAHAGLPSPVRGATAAASGAGAGASEDDSDSALYALDEAQLYQYNLVRILWAVQQVAVDTAGATLAIVFRNEVGHACEHAELGYRDGYKIACAVHGYLRLPAPSSRPSTPSRPSSRPASRPSTPTPKRSTTPSSPGFADPFSSPTKKQ